MCAPTSGGKTLVAEVLAMAVSTACSSAMWCSWLTHLSPAAPRASQQKARHSRRTIGHASSREGEVWSFLFVCTVLTVWRVARIGKVLEAPVAWQIRGWQEANHKGVLWTNGNGGGLTCMWMCKRVDTSCCVACYCNHRLERLSRRRTSPFVRSRKPTHYSIGCSWRMPHW